MSWIVEIEEAALDELNRIGPEHVRKILLDRIVNFYPNHPNIIAISEPLKGHYHGLRRFRLGEYRILFELDRVNDRIIIVKIGNRRDIYG